MGGCVSGNTAAIIHDGDTWQQYNCEAGVELLQTRIQFQFAIDDMVGLGSRTDSFSDKLSRYDGEYLVGYINKSEKAH